MAMAFAVAALAARRPVEVDGIESAEVSFPGFVGDAGGAGRIDRGGAHERDPPRWSRSTVPPAAARARSPGASPTRWGSRTSTRADVPGARGRGRSTTSVATDDERSPGRADGRVEVHGPSRVDPAELEVEGYGLRGPSHDPRGRGRRSRRSRAHPGVRALHAGDRSARSVNRRRRDGGSRHRLGRVRRRTREALPARRRRSACRATRATSARAARSTRSRRSLTRSRCPRCAHHAARPRRWRRHHRHQRPRRSTETLAAALAVVRERAGLGRSCSS